MIESLRAIGSVAIKELLHIYRDWRILILILLLPPLLTVIFGHAFEVTALHQAPTLLDDQDQSAESRKLIELLYKEDTFAWKVLPNFREANPDLLKAKVLGALIIPKGWGEGLSNGDPKPVEMILDGSDTNTAGQLEGAMREALGTFQIACRDEMIEDLPDEVVELGKNLNVVYRNKFTSAMTPWEVHKEILYNPDLRYMDYVTPGVIGLILQMMTVTLMACTLTRERESGTLSQLLITPLRRAEIIIGKVVPYLGISLFLVSTASMVSYFHFDVPFHQPWYLGIIVFLFLLCSLGLGLLISAFSHTQAQAIQFSVFFLLPVFPLSGAFAPLSQLPAAVRVISECFPLTHFCRAFRWIDLYAAGLAATSWDLGFLAAGALITCGGAALLLSRTQE